MSIFNMFGSSKEETPVQQQDQQTPKAYPTNRPPQPETEQQQPSKNVAAFVARPHDDYHPQTQMRAVVNVPQQLDRALQLPIKVLVPALIELAGNGELTEQVGLSVFLSQNVEYMSAFAQEECDGTSTLTIRSSVMPDALLGSFLEFIVALRAEWQAYGRVRMEVTSTIDGGMPKREATFTAWIVSGEPTRKVQNSFFL